MPIQFDSFDQQKIDNLKKLLDSEASKGKAKNYEIHVDGIKVVNKTNDPEEFYKFEDYMTPRTNSIKFILYCSGNSCRNEQYVYAMRASTPHEALEMGLDGFVAKSYSNDDIKDLLSKREKQRANVEEFETLRRIITDRENQLKERDEEIGVLKGIGEKQKSELIELESLKTKVTDQEKQLQYKEDEITTAQKVIEAQNIKIEKREADLAKVFAGGLELFAKSNAGRLAKMTGIEGLSGFFDQDKQQPENTEPQQESTEASFKKKETATNTIQLSEEEKRFLDLFKDLSINFSLSEMDQLIEIIQHLSNDKTQLPPVLQLLQEK